jgi:CRP/FNR family transcriptional regulator
MAAIEDLLAQNSVFGVLPPAKRAALIRQAVPRRLRKAEILLHRGDIWPYLFIVASGSVCAQKESSEGRNLVVTTFNSGDIFWGLGFFYEEMQMLVTLKACESSHLYLWSRETLLPVIKESGEFSWELMRLMVTRMTRASEILEEMTFQPVAGRLAKMLLNTAQKTPEGVGTRDMTLEEMAARIGSTREMVCRFLHRFADDGIIDITRTEFRVIDQKRLTNLAQNSKG